MVRAIAGFDWDAGNLAKCQKHGVSVGEIEMLFEGMPRIAPALKHSGNEDRFLAIGRTDGGRARLVRRIYVSSGGCDDTNSPHQRPLYAQEGIRCLRNEKSLG